MVLPRLSLLLGMQEHAQCVHHTHTHTTGSPWTDCGGTVVAGGASMAGLNGDGAE